MRNKKLTIAIFLIFVLVVLSYALYTARDIIYGPRLVIDIPSGVLEVSTQVIEITGSALNAQKLQINNTEIMTEQDGTFSEKMLLSVGTNTFVFDAVDKFGHSKSKTLQIVYTPKGDDVLQLKDNINK
jgi:hypothetical protein